MKALIASYSNPNQENRVQSQARLLKKYNWDVYTLGFGEDKIADTVGHFIIREQEGLRKNSIIRAIIHFSLPLRLRFRNLVLHRIPIKQLMGMEFDLIIFHDLQLLPAIELWNNNDCANTSVIIIDLHELHEPPNYNFYFFSAILAFPFIKYHKWLMNYISNRNVNLVLTVNSYISEFYLNLFKIKSPLVIMNCPQYLDLDPSTIQSGELKLIHHGKAARNRNLDILIDAMRLSKSRNHLTLMLTGDTEEIQRLKQLSLGSTNISIIDPVPMSEVSRKLNEFDVEIVFMPPATKNLEFTLPNKVFEAIQGRLALLVGESPALVKLVTEFQVGEVAVGWTSKDLAASIDALEVSRVKKYKENANLAAKILSSENEYEKLHAAIQGLLREQDLS